jgi:5-methylcytosine-specific restriction endonuclease McrA
VVRPYNTNIQGDPFDAATVHQVWLKARALPGHDPTQVRQDLSGTAIRISDCGTTSRYGWEIDHIMPVAHGGNDDVANLQPRHCENNRRKGNQYPWSR